MDITEAVFRLVKSFPKEEKDILTKLYAVLCQFLQPLQRDLEEIQIDHLYIFSQ